MLVPLATVFSMFSFPSSSRIIAAVVVATTFVSDAMSYIVLSTDLGAPGAQSFRP